MAQKISQGNIFGRIGTSIGQGLAEQLPKEVERSRLAGGLESLKGKENASTLDQIAHLTRSGANEQQISSYIPLLRQEQQSKALIQKSQEDKKLEKEKPNPFPKAQSKVNEQGQISPSTTTQRPIEETTKNYIPKTFDELQIRAGELMEQSPGLYGNDPSKALAGAQAEEAQAQAINQAYQTRRLNEQNVQTSIKAGLEAQNTRLGAKVPGNVYSDIEDKAINSVKPISEGGEGLTEQQAAKKYGKELDTISRDYEAIDALGNVTLVTRSPEDTKASIKSLRSKFKERGDLENFADTLVGKNGLSNGVAYYLAYPISENKELNNVMTKIPILSKETTLKRGFPEQEVPEGMKIQKTLEVSKKLAEKLGENGSPLAVAQELAARNYDPLTWLNYLQEHRKELDLSESQGRQLDKPKSFYNNLNDNWLLYFSGLDKLAEIQ